MGSACTCNYCTIRTISADVLDIRMHSFPPSVSGQCLVKVLPSKMSRKGASVVVFFHHRLSQVCWHNCFLSVDLLNPLAIHLSPQTGVLAARAGGLQYGFDGSMVGDLMAIQVSVKMGQRFEVRDPVISFGC